MNVADEFFRDKIRASNSKTDSIEALVQGAMICSVEDSHTHTAYRDLIVDRAEDARRIYRAIGDWNETLDNMEVSTERFKTEYLEIVDQTPETWIYNP